MNGRPGVAPAPAGRGTVRLGLLKGFSLQWNGEFRQLPLGAQRLIAFLAVHNQPLQRLFVAGNLWIDSSEEHANANLRTALWRLRSLDYCLVESTRSHLAMHPDVLVDLHEAGMLARRMVRREVEAGQGDLYDLVLSGDLLPDWYDDWVLVERERFRQLRLHALETLCEQLTAAGDFAAATEAGLAAVGGEPLRESAHRALIRTYLAEGNPGEAIRQYRLFRELLHAELGLDPSAQMEELVGALPIR